MATAVKNKVVNFPADKIAKGVHTFYPEMGERKVVAQMEAQLAHYGKHYFIDTPVQLPKGRGIEFIRQYKASDFTNGTKNHRVGWYEYKVTTNAFDKLKQHYSISMERLLD